ncbi:MAG: hypothetical protein JXA30_14990 [Deltaproteobacteria bacterium]|nr:hypothetical protein [Deltaproteobacteria bacterium]
MRYRLRLNHREFELKLEQRQQSLEVTCNEKPRQVRVEEQDGDRIGAWIDGRFLHLEVIQTAQGCALYYQGEVYDFNVEQLSRGTEAHRLRSSEADKELYAPMPGVVLSIEVKPGQKVKKGEELLVIEAMKMENEIRAPYDAEIKEIVVNVGDSVIPSQPLIYFV